jgi:hypothetical protein
VGLRSYGYGLMAFPFYAVRRIRIVAIDVPVEVATGFRGEYRETKKMIQVEWVPTGIETLDRNADESPTRLGRFVYYKDARFLQHAQTILGPWDEYAAEYERRVQEKRAEEQRNRAVKEQRERVLAKLAEIGVSAREASDYSSVLIEASEAERLLGLVADDASGDVV